MINTATSLISDVIGTDSKNSAFVYGFYSLMDRFECHTSHHHSILHLTAAQILFSAFTALPTQPAAHCKAQIMLCTMHTQILRSNF